MSEGRVQVSVRGRDGVFFVVYRETLDGKTTESLSLPYASLDEATKVALALHEDIMRLGGTPSAGTS